ncbi:MAG TPA: branched-chain amino acid ABC transporter permease [Candidatus Angelobacter sp.]
MNNRITNYVVLGLVLIAAMFAPFVVYPVFLMTALCFALFASGFNLLLGHVGLLSFGHAAFFATASYVTGYLMTQKAFTPGLGILAGTLAATVLGLIIAVLVIRRQGIYFAMITLAFAQLMYFVFLEAPFTFGEDGLQDIPRGRLLWLIDLSNDRKLYYVVLAIVVLGVFIVWRTIHSPFGQVLKAIRENEPRAISLGYDVNKYKILAFVISAALSGLAGATKAIVLHFATLTDADWHTSGDVVLMSLLGGMNTVWGPVVGAFSIVALEEQLPDAIAPFVTVIIGAIFIVCVLIFRRGIVGEIAALYRRVVGIRQP